MTGIVCGLSLLAGGFLGWSAPASLAALLLISLLARANHVWLLAACAAFAALGAVRVGPPRETQAPNWLDGQQSIIGEVTGAPIDDGSHQSFVSTSRPADEVNAVESTRICVIAPPLPRVGRGDRLLLSGEIQTIDEASERLAGSMRYRGCSGQLRVDSIAVLATGNGVRRAFDRLRRRMTDALLAAAPGDSGALLSGLATGDDTALTFSRRNAFIVTGTSHVTAVSGSNLSLLVATIVTGTSFAGSVRSPWRLVLVAGVVWFYVVLVGLSPPATRAAVVATLAVLARAIGRRPDFITLAVVAAAVEVVVRPADLHSLAFQLSTVSAISLVLGLGGRSPSGISGWLTHGIAATAVTQAATAALLVLTFGRLSVYAIPANLIIGPLCSAAFPIALGAGLVGVVDPTFAAALAFPARLLADLVLAVVSGLASLPFADAGNTLPTWVPWWPWLAVGSGMVIAMSHECRGGIARQYRRARAWNPRETAVAVGAAGGTFAGLMIAAIVR